MFIAWLSGRVFDLGSRGPSPSPTSFTGVTAPRPWARTLILAYYLFNTGWPCRYVTERLLVGRKESRTLHLDILHDASYIILSGLKHHTNWGYSLKFCYFPATFFQFLNLWLPYYSVHVADEIAGTPSIVLLSFASFSSIIVMNDILIWCSLIAD